MSLLDQTAKQKTTLLDSVSQDFDALDFDADKALQTAVDTDSSIITIEDFYSDILEEEAHFSKIADPQDVDVWQMIEQQKDKPIVGLQEQIRRMDSLDWLKRAPVSPVGAQQLALTIVAVARQNRNKYETIGEWRRKYAEQIEISKYAEPLYPEEKRLMEPIPSRYDSLGDDELSPEGEKDYMTDIAIIEYWLEKARQAQEDKTFVAKIFEVGSYMPGWMITFCLTGGLAKIGSVGAKEFAYKALGEYAKTKSGQAVLRASGWAGGAITRASLGMSHRVIESTLERRMPESITVGPNGEYVFQLTAETWAESVLKGWGAVVIEAASEEAGAAITGGLKGAIRKLPFGKRFISEVQKRWMALAPANTAKVFANKFFTPAGYSDIIGELGEESLETILKAITDIEDYGSGPQANILERVQAGITQDIKNFPVTATVVAMPGVARYGVAKAAGKMAPTVVKGALVAEPPKALEAKPAPAEEKVSPLERVYMKGFVARISVIRGNAENIVAKAKRGKRRLSPEAKIERIATIKEELGLIKKHYESIGKDIKENPELLKELRQIKELLPEYEKVINSFAKSPSKKGFEKIAAVSDKIAELSTGFGAKIGEQTIPEKPLTLPGDTSQFTSEAAGFEAQETAAQYLNDPVKADLLEEEPDTSFTKQWLNDRGIKSSDGYEPLAEKDFREINKFLQMPDDVRRTFPQFDPVYQVQRAREVQRATLNNQFAESTKPYFDLSVKEKILVDKVLVEAERNPTKTFGPKRLKEIGLNKTQIKGFLSIRTSLDDAANTLVEAMKEAGIAEDKLTEFDKQRKNYIPHKWYGNWAVIVRAKEKIIPKKRLTKKEVGAEADAFLTGKEKPVFEEVKELKKPETIFMTKTDFADRFKERKRLQKLYPNDEVIIMKANKIPYDAFQQASPFAVTKIIDLAIEKAQVDKQTAEAMKESLRDLYKSKGFGAHFISRKGTPGFAENLAKPLAEYFLGFSGYISKMQAIKAFPTAVSNIKPNRTPNLYKYTMDYINYVIGDQYEFATAKSVAYSWYLFGNIKSACLNTTQNFILGWPELAKQTNFALPKMLWAMSMTATNKLTNKEKVFIKQLTDAGYLEPGLTAEISGYHGEPLAVGITGKAKKIVSMADIFRHIEKFNRVSMAVALHQAEITDVKKVGETIDTSHFHYGKGNRPALMRGYISPVMTFRSFTINYFTWLKNQIKAGEIAPVARSMAALVFFGGFTALPFYAVVSAMWRKVFHKDIEAEARGALGELTGRTFARGAPSMFGVSFTGSVGMGDILPTNLKEIGGVFADIPARTIRVGKDIKTKQYLRAIEDSSPEILRNPLAAYRLYTDGNLTRNGRVLMDYETLEPLKISGLDATKKALGFQPIKLAENWDVAETLDIFQTERMAKKQNWADLIYLAYLNKDLELFNDTQEQWQTYNTHLIRRGELPITEDELNQMIAIRARPANIPPKFMWPALKDIRQKYWGK